jgi:hypothetical protein
MTSVQAEKITANGTDLLWDLPASGGFRADMPFSEMKQVPVFIGTATFKKKTP